MVESSQNSIGDRDQALLNAWRSRRTRRETAISLYRKTIDTGTNDLLELLETIDKAFADECDAIVRHYAALAKEPANIISVYGIGIYWSDNDKDWNK